MENKLYQSPVQFIEDRKKGIHRYELNGKELKGVTGLLSRQCISSNYDGVSDSVLMAAAEHGIMVHTDIQNHEEFGLDYTTNDGSLWDAIKPSKLDFVAQEYIVSDEKEYASKVDLVMYDKELNGYVLIDIKTSSKLNVESVKWQLNIYRYFWKMQNPELPIVEMAAAWIPNQEKYKGKEYRIIDDIDDDKIQNVLDCDANGLIANIYQDTLPAEVTDVIKEMYEIVRAEEEYKNKKEELVNTIKAAMEQYNVKKWENDLITISYVEPSKRVSLDTKRLEAEQKEIYEKYKKESNVKSSIRIKLNNGTNR